MSPLSTSLLALGEEPKRRFKPRLRTRFRQDADVASYSELPPFTQSPTLIGWAFFCPKRHCWRGSGHLPLERALAGPPTFGLDIAGFLSPFSVGLLTVQVPKSTVFAGLRAGGCGFRLLRRRRPRTQSNRPGCSRRLQRRDQRTLHLPARRAAALDKPLQRTLNPLQIGKPGAHVC